MPNYFTELKDGPSGPSFKVKDEEAEQAIGAIGTALGNKVDKEAGKGLSTNDYSDTEKGKVEANAEAIEATQDMISDAYDSTHTYNKGEYCIHENILYRCNVNGSTGVWNPLEWDVVNVSTEFLPLPRYPGELVLTIATSSSDEFYIPTRSGYLCMAYPMSANATHIYGKIRAGSYPKYGLTFDMNTKAYAGEPVFTLPVRANVTYTIHIEGHISDMNVYLF